MNDFLPKIELVLTVYLFAERNGNFKLHSKLVHEKTHAPNRTFYEISARCAR